MDAREKLVMSHLNLVRFIANKFKNRGEPSTTTSCRSAIWACSRPLTASTRRAA